MAWEDLLKAPEAVDKEASLIEALYLDAQGIEDKGIVGELRMRLRRYVEALRSARVQPSRSRVIPW